MPTICWNSLLPSSSNMLSIRNFSNDNLFLCEASFIFLFTIKKYALWTFHLKFSSEFGILLFYFLDNLCVFGTSHEWRPNILFGEICAARTYEWCGVLFLLFVLLARDSFVLLLSHFYSFFHLQIKCENQKDTCTTNGFAQFKLTKLNKITCTWTKTTCLLRETTLNMGMEFGHSCKYHV